MLTGLRPFAPACSNLKIQTETLPLLEVGRRHWAVRQQIRRARDHERPMIRIVRESPVRASVALTMIWEGSLEVIGHVDASVGF
jgi:hypothetical protein